MDTHEAHSNRSGRDGNHRKNVNGKRGNPDSGFIWNQYGIGQQLSYHRVEVWIILLTSHQVVLWRSRKQLHYFSPENDYGNKKLKRAPSPASLYCAKNARVEIHSH